MRHIVRDGVAWFVGLSVTLVSPAKAAEPIEMPFGLLARVHMLKKPRIRSGPSPMGRGNFEGEGRSIVKYRDTLR